MCECTVSHDCRAVEILDVTVVSSGFCVVDKVSRVVTKWYHVGSTGFSSD